MKKHIAFLLVAAAVFAVFADTAGAFEGRLLGRRSAWMAQTYSWHGSYYDPAWGCPVTVLVPPNAEFQTNYGWGIPASRRSTSNSAVDIPAISSEGGVE